MAAGLRQLTERERAIVGHFRARHGAVRGLTQPIADDTGGIGMPLVRLGTLARLEQRGTISASEAAAGEMFARLFRSAALDPLQAADLSRAPGGAPPGDLPPSAERSRRRVSVAMTALGGAASPAAGAIWHVCGLEWSVSRWSTVSRRPREHACGILIGALAALAAHFSGGRR